MPVIVNVLRGGDIESCHEVDVVAVDPEGRILWSRGVGKRDVFARSALKPVQALPFVRSGAADRFAISDERLAVACGSHGGEPRHVEVVGDWLADLGLGPDDLECGAHVPVHRASADALAAAATAPTPLHNNCSGKHAGFLSVCRQLDLDHRGYLAPGHALQADHLTPAIEECCGVDLAGTTPGIDGCGIPVWAMPLDRLAAGWAVLGRTDEGRRIFAAMTAQPFMVAGTDRACTRLMEAGRGAFAVKTGAEGVFCGIDLASGAAIALKARDGATRAADLAIEWALAELGLVPAPVPRVLRNWVGTEVGSVRVAG
ncbi:MAG: asparaginase [Acidimicrobiales bacterium]